MDDTSAEDREMIREFLVESHENLSRLDQDLVALEKTPQDADLLSSIFRTIHTIKGACGFLSFSILEAITHQAETLLSQLRDGKRQLTPALVSLILETVDATRQVLAAIESSGREGQERFEDLTERLRHEAQAATQAESPKKTLELPEEGGPPAPAQTAEEPPIERREDRRKWGRRKEDKEEDGLRPSAAVDANIRVGVGLLDKLMDLVGELVLARNQILQFNIEREDAALKATSQRLNLITTELQESVMKTRMQPIGVVWAVASDDAHDYVHFEDRESPTPGKAWIVVQAPALSMPAILDALRNGNFYASTGVALDSYSVDEKGISLKITPTLSAHFKTRFIGSNGAVLAEVSGTSPHYAFQGNEVYVRALIIDSNDHRAWTQPVFRDGRKKESATK